MGLFGKILLVINLLAAGGFAYLAIQDYKGRQSITAAGFRHIILLRGFPLEGGPDVIPPRAASSSDNYSDFLSEEIPFEIAKIGEHGCEHLDRMFSFQLGPVGMALIHGGRLQGQRARFRQIFSPPEHVR